METLPAGQTPPPLGKADPPPLKQTATAADSTHLTGMHSCFIKDVGHPKNGLHTQLIICDASIEADAPNILLTLSVNGPLVATIRGMFNNLYATYIFYRNTLALHRRKNWPHNTLWRT